MQSSRANGVKDPADYIHANATKIILSIYPVKIAARARYLLQKDQGRQQKHFQGGGNGKKTKK